MAKHKKFHLGIKGLIRNKKGEILLLLKSPDRIKKFSSKTYWDIPGGRVEKGDSVEKTLRREIREETGIENFENKGLFHAVVSNIKIQEENCGLILFIYEISLVDDFEIRLNDEHTEFSWFNINEAAELLRVKYPTNFINRLKEYEKENLSSKAN